MNAPANEKRLATGWARRKLAPKTSFKINNEADRQKFMTAAREVIVEHRDVIRALGASASHHAPPLRIPPSPHAAASLPSPHTSGIVPACDATGLATRGLTNGTEIFMGAIGKAVDGFVSDVGNAVKGVADGVGKVAEGGVDLAKGALSLNPKEMEAGAKDVVTGGVSAASNAMDLTPEGLEASAANNLLDGAADACGLGGSDESQGSGDSGGGISGEDLMKTKEFAEKMPGGLSSLLKI